MSSFRAIDSGFLSRSYRLEVLHHYGEGDREEYEGVREGISGALCHGKVEELTSCARTSNDAVTWIGRIKLNGRCRFTGSSNPSSQLRARAGVARRRDMPVALFFRVFSVATTFSWAGRCWISDFSLHCVRPCLFFPDGAD